MDKLPEPIWISLQETLDIVLDRTGKDLEAVKRSLIDAFAERKIETQGRGGNYGGLDPQPKVLGAEWHGATVSWEYGKLWPASGHFHGIRYVGFDEIIVRREDVTRWLESANSTPARDSHTTPAKDKGGRDPEYDWGAFQREIMRIANTPAGLSTQRDLVKQMLDWCTGKWTECPDERNIRRQVKKCTDGVIPPSQ